MNAPGYVVHGLDLSYFTGKLESALRAKGLPYRLQEMNTASFRALGSRTGIRQMPHLELPDGTLLTDTGAIIDHLESAGIGEPLTPHDPATAFIDRLLEVWADEWLWRPALHYRWSYKADAALMANRIASGMLRDLPLPIALRQAAILRRQRHTYLKQDGITGTTSSAVEALYRATLAALEPALASRPFLLGARPTRADVGLMGPMFRHFGSDPTPLGLMRAEAPQLHAWVARMWALSPSTLAGVPLPGSIPADLLPIAHSISHEFLPYLAANAVAVQQGGKVTFQSHGATFHIPPSRFRAGRLALLQRRFAALDAPARTAVGLWLHGPGVLADTPQDAGTAPRLADRHLTPIGAP